MPDRLRISQEQSPTIPQREVEQRDELLLDFGLEVDQQVAATDQVEFREGNVADHVLDGEHHRITEPFIDRKMIALVEEKPIQTIGRDVGRDTRGIRPRACVGQGGFVDVGREDLEVPFSLRPVELLDQHHGQRVCFLAGGAAGHPDADRRVGLHLAHQGLDRLRLEDLPRFALPEEGRHTDQHVLEQGFDLVRVGPQQLEVVGTPFHVLEDHSPLDAAHQSALLVAAEFILDAVVQERQDSIEIVDGLLAWGLRSGRVVETPVLHVFEQDFGHALDRQDVIDVAGGDGAARHPVIVRGLRGLSDRHPAAGLDRLQAQRPFRARAREDDADGAFLLVLGQGCRKVSIGNRRPRRLERLGEVELPLADRQGPVRRDHVDVVRLDGHRVGDLDHFHGRDPAQELDHEALVGRVQVLDQDKSHPAVRGHRAEELLERIEPPRRGPEPNHGALRHARF